MAERELRFAASPGIRLLFLLLLLTPFAGAQERQAKKVLLVEDQMSAPAVEAVARAFEADLISKSPSPIELYRESLDTILIPDGNYQLQVRQWYERKYSKRKLDLIVAIGPEAHKFLQAEHARFFPGVPVVFCLDIKPDHDDATPEPGFTGVWMEFDPVGTVDVARQLLPATKHVAVVAGGGLFDQLLTHSVKTKLRGYQGVDLTYLADLDMRSLLAKVHGLSNDTIVLYLTFTKDQYERHLFAAYTMPLVSTSADVPVFGLIDLLVGRGIVGGQVTGFIDGAPIAAELAFRVLQGEKPEDIPVVTVANRYQFDWKEMKRWGIDPARLPAGSVVLNRGPSVWERYKSVIVAVIAILLLQAVLVLYLLIERAKRRRAQRALEHDVAERKKAEAALIDLSGQLINTQEEERSRLARELHDDFSQRLAMLAIDLEKAAIIVIKDPDKAIERLHELCNQTSDIGGDLHRVSHNLHSSILDLLGLEEAVRSLCMEFTEQQEITVEFASHDFPRDIPSGTSLCLFRIAQEALRNVQKHSGSCEAFVELEGDGEEVTMIIADSGVGFDSDDPAFKAGLGLRSMRERLRQVGGSIEIESGQGAGTTLRIHAPCPRSTLAFASGAFG